jgi:hypothetical protein
VCVARIGTQHYFYLDGKGGAFSISNRTSDTAEKFKLGRSSSAGAEIPFAGYIDGFRILIGGRRIIGPPMRPHPRHLGR